MIALPETVRFMPFPSTLGWMAAAGRGEILLALTFGHHSPRKALAALGVSSGCFTDAEDWNPRLARRLQAFAQGAIDDFRDISIEIRGLPQFSRKVIEQCRRISYGGTLSYGQLAARVGSPRAARAVGNVMASNRTPLIVPCHRVVAANGNIGSYSAAGGRRTKLRLLETESKSSGLESQPKFTIMRNQNSPSHRRSASSRETMC